MAVKEKVDRKEKFYSGWGKNVLYEDSSGHGTTIAGIIGALDNEEGISEIHFCFMTNK